MRSSGAVSMAATIEWNMNHGQKNVRLYEIGKCYEVKNSKPVETRTLTIGVTGIAREQSIHEAPRELSFADLKGDLDQLLDFAGGATWQPANNSWLVNGSAAQIALASNGRPIGDAGKVADAIAQTFKLRQDLYLAEFQLEPLLDALFQHKQSLRYEPLPRFPAVERDFSLILPESTRFAQVEAIVRALGIPELRRMEAVDLFRGGQVPAGKYSLLLRVAFQSEQATLTESQLTDFSRRIASALNETLGAALRAS